MCAMYSPSDGAKIIKFLCRPLQCFLTDKSIGRFLQFIHLFGYISLVYLTIFYKSTRYITLTLFGTILLMFFIFNGCILTKAEMDYLGENETTPGLVLEAFGLRPVNKERDRFVQTVGSLIALALPIIFILFINDSNSINGSFV